MVSPDSRLASPKSETWGRPSRSRRMLEGLRSRWMIPRRVGVIQRLGHEDHQRGGLLGRDRGLLEPLGQGRPLDEGADQADGPLDRPGVVGSRRCWGGAGPMALRASRRKPGGPRGPRPPRAGGPSGPPRDSGPCPRPGRPPRTTRRRPAGGARTCPAGGAAAPRPRRGAGPRTARPDRRRQGRRPGRAPPSSASAIVGEPGAESLERQPGSLRRRRVHSARISPRTASGDRASGSGYGRR